MADLKAPVAPAVKAPVAPAAKPPAAAPAALAADFMSQVDAKLETVR
jgi:hypothetical protein